LRDLALLESAVARPRATFDSKELYPDLFTKAAALMDSLINNYPFLDGNKRTASRRLVILSDQWIETHGFFRRVGRLHHARGSGRLEIDDLANWLRAKT